jgi:hypothetical protein
MKQFKFLSSAAIVMLMLFSCNSGGNESTTTTGTDSTMKDSTTTMTQAPPATPAPPAMTMIIKQKVANFAKWFPGYEAHDSARVPNGLHNFVVARGLNKDSNTVLVALHMDDTAKAKQFAMSPGLMEAMKKAGVTGKPTISYNVSKFHDSTTDATTERAILTFKVKDYDAWKKVFDGDQQDRTNAGMTTRAINVDVNDPNKVSLVMVITDMKKTADFMHTKELKHRMDSAGVVGAPDVFFYHVVKQYQ